MPWQKGFMRPGGVSRHYTTTPHLLNTGVGCCYFQGAVLVVLCWVDGLGARLKP
jgi:hypothetical protein